MISALLFAGAAAVAAASSPQFIMHAAQRAAVDPHPTLRFSKDTFILARMRWDYEHRGPEASLPAGKDEWGFVRRRFSVEGGIGGQIAFEIETDLEGTERWKDVYVEYTPHDALHVRAGKFVIPFGYERTTSLDVLDFAYRSMASSQLAPARDRGVMALGSLWNRKLTYDAGWFEDGDTLAARVVGRNFSSGMLGGLEIGAAVMAGDLVDEIGALRGQTALGHSFFAGAARGPGRRRRTTMFGAYRAGPAAVKSEYMTARDRHDDGAAQIDAAGWYVSGSVVMTGEAEADAHHPRRLLFRGGIGSIELAARTERLTFEVGGAASRARAHTVGVTWQPMRFFRVQWNAVRDILPARRMWTRVLRFHLSI